MKTTVAAVFTGLVALVSAWEPDLTPPKQPFTPFFHLAVLYSPNISLIGQYITSPEYSNQEFQLTRNYSAATTFYQSGPNYTSSQHPLGGPVLVHNISDAVPYNVPGTPYTPRNLIVGSGDCLTCPDAGLPVSAGLFDKSQADWDDFGSFQIDFHMDLITHAVHFNLTEAGALSGWTKTSQCWFNDGVEERSELIVTNRYWPEDDCSEVKLVWTFAGF